MQNKFFLSALHAIQTLQFPAQNGKLAKGGNTTDQEKGKEKLNCIDHKGIWSLRVVKIPSSQFDFRDLPRNWPTYSYESLYLESSLIQLGCQNGGKTTGGLRNQKKPVVSTFGKNVSFFTGLHKSFLTNSNHFK